MKRENLISVFLGSTSDLDQVAKGLRLLENWKIPYRLHILSAHRTPTELEKVLARDEEDGTRVVIAGAGMAAHLPGVIASKTFLPVIGIPIVSGSLGGMDALYSIVQMPPGIPVATMAIGSSGAQNAVIFAAQVLGGKWGDLVIEHRKKSALDVLNKNKMVNEKGFEEFLRK